MTATLNRHTFPSGGWQFYQPQTKWRNPMPLGYTFEQTVEAIIKHRIANKAIALKYGLSTDFNIVADELEKYTRVRLGIPEEPPPKPLTRTVVRPIAPRDAAAAGVNTRQVVRQVNPQPVQAPPQQSILNRFASVASSLKKVAVGVGTVLDCVQGQPVTPDVSAERARICAAGQPEGKPCPKNGTGDFTTWFTVPLSEAIRKAEAKLKEQNLSTPYDDRLIVCEGCNCPLKLKVHCNLKTLKDHMIPEVLSDLHPDCWITK